VTEPKIVIAGTGRAGTTLLVAVLSDLGLDTGYPPGIQADTRSGGLERNILLPNAPRIVKAPGLSTRLRPMLEQGLVEIEHVIVPVRDLDVAAASRARVAGYGRHLGVRGGFTGTRSAARQRDVLANMIYELIFTLTVFDIPSTFLLFPRFASDFEYTFERLEFLAPEKTADDFRRALAGRFDASKIREEALTPLERARAASLQPWTLARRVAGKVSASTRADARPVPSVPAPTTIAGPDEAAASKPRSRVAAGSNGATGAKSQARKLLHNSARPVLASRAWRLWRARDLQRRASGPLEDVQNEWSVIAAPSASDSGPSDELVQFALRAVTHARETELASLVTRRPGNVARLGRLSGQHYRILAGLAAAWGARRVVEIGTYLGASALAFLDAPTVEHVITFDIKPWDAFESTYLRLEDFRDRLEQRIGDLSDPDVFGKNAEDLASADLIFCDAPKDGVFEPEFLRLLFSTESQGSQLLVLDDIRVLTMIRAWHEIPYDKLDLSSFGHWSGTGIAVRGSIPRAENE
jgi:predicted O-methyltransferase YrrM